MILFTIIRRISNPITQINQLSRSINYSVKTFYRSPPLHKYNRRYPMHGSKNPCLFEKMCVPPSVSEQFKNQCEFRLNGSIPTLKTHQARSVIARRLTVVENCQWYAKSDEGPGKGGPVRQSGGGIGKLDAANEEGFFHKVNKARLEKLKKLLKDKKLGKEQSPVSPPEKPQV